MCAGGFLSFALLVVNQRWVYVRLLRHPSVACPKWSVTRRSIWAPRWAEAVTIICVLLLPRSLQECCHFASVQYLGMASITGIPSAGLLLGPNNLLAAGPPGPGGKVPVYLSYLSTVGCDTAVATASTYIVSLLCARASSRTACRCTLFIYVQLMLQNALEPYHSPSL